MKLDLRWLILFISSLCMQEALGMLNFALAPFGVYVYIPALFLAYSSSFMPFRIGFMSTVVLGLALEARTTTQGSLAPLLIAFCSLHYIQSQAVGKSRICLRRYLQPLNCFLWASWLAAKDFTIHSLFHKPLPLLLSLVCSQGLLWAFSLWYMDLQHRLVVLLHKKLKPSV